MLEKFVPYVQIYVASVLKNVASLTVKPAENVQTNVENVQKPAAKWLHKFNLTLSGLVTRA
jgi:hypothetical protein